MKDYYNSDDDFVLNVDTMSKFAVSLLGDKVKEKGIACKKCRFFDPKNTACRHDDNLRKYWLNKAGGMAARCIKRDQWKIWNAKNDCPKYEEGEFVRRYR